MISISVVIGPLFVPTIVKVTVSPTLGVALSTVFVIERSAPVVAAETVKETDAVLFPKLLSGTLSVETIFAVLVISPAESTRAFILMVTISPLIMSFVPVQVTALPAFVQSKLLLLLSVSETQVNPAGKLSVILISVVAGPLFIAVIVKVTVSPTVGVALSTVLMIDRSLHRLQQ